MKTMIEVKAASWASSHTLQGRPNNIRNNEPNLVWSYGTGITRSSSSHAGPQGLWVRYYCAVALGCQGRGPDQRSLPLQACDQYRRILCVQRSGGRGSDCLISVQCCDIGRSINIPLIIPRPSVGMTQTVAETPPSVGRRFPASQICPSVESLHPAVCRHPTDAEYISCPVLTPVQRSGNEPVEVALETPFRPLDANFVLRSEYPTKIWTNLTSSPTRPSEHVIT